MGKVIGIDLGTSTSEICVFSEGKPQLIENDLGDYITPSVVGLDDDGNIIVGKHAKDQMLLKPDETILEVKRLMGTDEKIILGNKEFTPEEISAEILKYLYKCAKEKVDDVIDGAVITVPAYFSDEQRKATVAAGIIADINVMRIINEPTAASLDYGIEHMQDCKNIVVYDLGGGTLDVTILEMFEGIIDVKTSCGNNKLGGKDFDSLLINYLVEKFQEEYNKDVTGDKKAMMRLKSEAENCKIELSKKESYEVILPFFAEVNGEPVSLNQVITREHFESLIKDKVYGTENQIKRALEDARLSYEDIDIVILVGGSTKIPIVRNFLKGLFKKDIQDTVDPDMAVVRGAAIQAGIIKGELSSETDIMITDICPYTLGIEVMEFIHGYPVTDIMDVMIPRNTTIPVEEEKEFRTVADNQEAVEIKVYQGDARRASQNNLIGEFKLSGIPKNSAGEEKIVVIFGYDKNGILNVQAKIKSTGKDAEITIETTGIKMEKEVDTTKWKDYKKSKKYRSLINKAQRLLDNEETDYYTDDLIYKMNELKKAIVLDEDEDKLAKLNDELSDLIYDMMEEED